VDYSAVSGSFPLSADYLVDPSGTLDIDSVVGQSHSAFQSLGKKILNFGYTTDTFWFRFKISGIPEHANPLVLLFGYALVDELTLYLPQDDGSFLIKKSGRNYPIPLRELKNRLPSFLLKVTPAHNEKYIYIQARTASSAQFPMTLVPLVDYANRDHDFQFVNALYFGAMAIMAIYNLIFYVVTLQRKYGFYVLFVASSCLLVMAIYGYNFEYLWPYAVAFNKHSITLTIGLVLFSISFFYGSSLTIFNRKPRLRRLTYASGLLGLFLGTLSLVLPYSLAVKINLIYLIAMSLFFIGLSLYLSLLKHRSAYFYLLAFTGLILGTMIYTLQTFGLILGNYLTVLAPQIGSAMQVVLLSFALADQYRELRKEKEEVQNKLLIIQDEHIRTLDAKVEEKTRDIRSILSTITQGIFTIGGDVPRINPEYSEFLKVIVDTDAIEGRNPLELLFHNSNLPKERISQMENVLTSILNEDELAFTLNAEHLVSEYEKGHGSERQYFHVDWTPVLNDESKVGKVLVTVRDVTQIRNLEHSAHKQNKDMTIIKELLGADPTRIQRFLKKAESYLGTCLKAISHQTNEHSLHQIFIIMHTLKGDARTLGLAMVSNQVHELEEKISKLERNAPHEGWRLTEDFQSLIDLVNDFERVQREKLNRTNDDISPSIPITQLVEILDPLQHISDEDIKEQSRAAFVKVKDCLYGLCHESLQGLFEDLAQSLDSTAKHLGKMTPEIHCQFDRKVYIQQDIREALANAFIHIFRNSLDHGIEHPIVRQQKGKPESGRITISGAMLPDAVRIHYEDDGNGLNLEKIWNIARERGLLPRHGKPSDQEIGQLIFASGFSTADELSEISGRGIGMSAARSFLERLGMTLQIELKPYTDRQSAPFRLVLIIPNRLTLKTA
jgi:HPt (histidine-containing phosphotransfer) domain-containing protein